MVNYNKTLDITINFILNYYLELSINLICMHSQLIEWNGLAPCCCTPKSFRADTLALKQQTRYRYISVTIIIKICYMWIRMIGFNNLNLPVRSAIKTDKDL